MTEFIVLGITSSLAGSLLSRFPSTSRFVGFVRPLTGDDNVSNLKREHRKTLEDDSRITMVNYNGSDEDLIHHVSSYVSKNISFKARFKVLYLSTEISMKVLSFLRDSNIPTLAIGSGAVTDWGNDRGGFDIVTLSATESTRGFAKYIERKARAERIATITIHPGFYLPQEDSPFTWSGLHIDSCEQIFSKEFNENFNWGKDKFFTPMALIAELIFNWAIRTDFSYLCGGYDCGTDSAYPRWKLRELAGFQDVPDSVKEKYPFSNDSRYAVNMKRTRDTFGFTQISPEQACNQARKWVEKHESEYKLLRKA